MILSETIRFSLTHCNIWYSDPTKTKDYLQIAAIKLTIFLFLKLTSLLDMPYGNFSFFVLHFVPPSITLPTASQSIPVGRVDEYLLFLLFINSN